MSQIGNTAENGLLDAIFNQTSYSPTAIYCSLHTSDPGDTGASEVSGGSYGRQTVTTSFGASSSGTVTSSADISFTGMPDTTGDDISHVGIWDAATSGNFLWGATLTAAKTTNSGDTFTISSGNLSFSLD